MAGNKLRTQQFLSSIGIATPRTALASDFFNSPEPWNFPVILKPVNGSSSIGLRMFESVAAVQAEGAAPRDYVAQELCDGEEYTVNLFFDRTGLRCAVPHYRYETRAGEVSKAVTRRVPSLMAVAEKLGEALRGQAFGALCFQAMVNGNGAATLFELNARFGGGYPLADQAGAHFAKWLMEAVLELPSTANNSWRENVTMLRYDAAIFGENAAPG
jgi:carbamoyl-phosphate synthase large subunit